jgi:hypothetical protein
MVSGQLQVIKKKKILKNFFYCRTVGPLVKHVMWRFGEKSGKYTTEEVTVPYVPYGLFNLGILLKEEK